MNLGIIRCADNFIISGVGWSPGPWVNVEPRQALRLRDGVVLPGVEVHAVYRTL